MPPRLSLFGTFSSRSLAIRTRPSIVASRSNARIVPAPFRGFVEEKSTTHDIPPPRGPNQDQLPHVSEEAGETSRITGETGPELDQGTPVQEIFQRDEKIKEEAPEVIKQEMGKKSSSADSSSSSSFSSAEGPTFANLMALGRLENVAAGGHASDPVAFPGHRFGVPDLPLPPMSHLHYRYDPVVAQVTTLLMKDGKKSVAQRNMSYILNHLRTAPPPTVNPSKPLVPGSPPPHHLPLDPVQYLTVAIDSVAPLLRIRSQRGAAGGGAALQIPVPLGQRQRRRQAVKWILDAASKKKSRGSGRGMFAQRIAEEIINVVEGKSSVWDRRLLVHKTGTGARANLNYSAQRRR
ncbi:30S ribosomal protein-like protein S7 [Xylogone sp. PMI_703]|nr:30S ribosomal protein-like protein S7 [Xylogone sp. PMI_703]